MKRRSTVSGQPAKVRRLKAPKPKRVRASPPHEASRPTSSAAGKEGEVARLLGTIGFEGRFDYAAIGTVSNVASRLCDEAKPGQILISPRVLTKVENAVRVEPVGEFELKGIRRPLAAYNVLGAQSSET
jgi:hypothetical protein